jgi:predicted flap endonuclease-1-like 5' DNA nuclease
MTPVKDIEGVGPALAKMLAENGFDSAEAVAAVSVERLMELPRVGALRAKAIHAAA